MAKFDNSRMSDATKVRSVDNAHNQLEEDIATILGVPLNQVITASVFGTNPDSDTPGESTKPVQLNGKVKGILSFLLASPESDAADSVGLEFDDGTSKKRLTLVDGSLSIHEWNDPNWDLVADIEAAAAGSFAGLSDVDAGLTALPDVGEANKVIVVEPGGQYYTHAVAASGGVGTYNTLTDVEKYATANVGDVPSVNAGKTALEWQSVPGLSGGWGVWLEQSAPQNFTPGGSFQTLDDLADQGASGPWDTPTITSGYMLNIPNAGFYMVNIKVKEPTPTVAGTRSFKVKKSAGASTTPYGPGMVRIDSRASFIPYLGGESVHENQPNSWYSVAPLFFGVTGASKVEFQMIYLLGYGGTGPPIISVTCNIMVIRIGL